jgi:hypothetical protein
MQQGVELSSAKDRTLVMRKLEAEPGLYDGNGAFVSWAWLGCWCLGMGTWIRTLEQGHKKPECYSLLLPLGLCCGRRMCIQ